MTHASTSAHPVEDRGCGRPQPTTPVLLHRNLVPDLDTQALSVFGDDRWDLTPGVFEAHTQVRSLDFADCPADLRSATKHYCWELINHTAPRSMRGASTDRLSLPTVSVAFRRLLPFLTWLHVHGITSFEQVTPAGLDRFLDSVRVMESSPQVKAPYLIEIRRLWCYRNRLPDAMRLPATPAWDGEDNQDLLNLPQRGRENATPRIHPDTLQPLLVWSLRFVEDFAEDILTAFADYQRLAQRGGGSDHRGSADQHAGRVSGWLHPVVLTWLAELRDRGGSLPGVPRPDGTREIHWLHLNRLFDCATSAWWRASRVRDLVLNSGIPIADDAYLDTATIGRLHEKPWRATPITYTEAPRLARLLLAACAVSIAYLCGMRPGELLNLERDCVEHDPVTDLWLIRGQHVKGAVGPDGQKLPEGSPRPDPWTVIAPVARAIDVLHRLHPHQMLFPNQLRNHGTGLGPQLRAQPITGRKTHTITEAIGELISWVNRYCHNQGLDTERIPADPRGRVTLSRFRRTLAWHIVRRPRGLIAGAIQYGHLHVQITLGYSGSYASGFPDDHSYEDWLFRLEQLADSEERLAAGEHVSGPAADTYRHRVHTAQQKFAGRVLTSSRQARDLLDNPLLQIFPGRAMTCVFDTNKALCRTLRTEGDTRRTPDQADCRPQCKNITYTDRDIIELQARARRLHEITQDPLAPPIRRAREQHELDRTRAIIRRHGR